MINYSRPVFTSYSASTVRSARSCPGPGAQETLAATAATLAPVATQADVLVGHDMGGVLAAMLAQPFLYDIPVR